ncbi:flagellar filament capping protein FliD [Nitrincola tapanii]|uniref:Flagellar hook-associated protein 2 n=1 Tax=Nitrincola tapanii TaxID=1708751 RepID=A0A5A9W7T2_9GAMM|nr:flagellar filament capping protein FliD [Nitrincola tapanii]KAA0876593.1 flagellar hook protein [Nitrincola tapanii]
MTNIISSLGGGSGIDTVKLVKDLVEIERQPVEQRLDKKQATLQAQISGYGALKGGLSDFQALLKPLNNPETFAARNVSFTESNTVTPTKIDANAVTGNYQVEVMQLARVQSLSTAVVSDTKAEMATGTLNIRFGTWNGDLTSFNPNAQKEGVQIKIDSTNNTLEGIRDAINGAKVGVQASIIADGGQFRLLIASPTGETQALEISVDEDAGATGLSLSMFEFNQGAQALTQNQAAQDARVRINGLEVSRASNDVKDVIPGLEFTLNRASPNEIINFSISEDKATGEQAVRDFVEGFNDFFKFASTLTGYSRDEDNQLVRGDLATDSIAKTMVSRMREILVAAVPGLQNNQASLAMIGIRTELDGTLSINETEFSRAMNDNFAMFGNIFSPQVNSSSPLLEAKLGTSGASAQPGQYDIRITTQPAKGSLMAGVFDPIDTFPLNTGTDEYSFKVRINGVVSGLITLPENQEYSSAEALATELQTLINSDAKIQQGRAQVDVSFNAAENRFEFVSREFGAISNVGITEASTAMEALGLGQRNGVAGRDVAGTINGVAGFGAGNVLLPALGTPAFGLNFTVAPGVSEARVDYSRGLSGELDRLILDFLSKDGAVSTREASINNQLEAISTDRERLDARMDKRLLQLQAQFQAMERIISSFQATGDQLDGILDRLPFTASKR